MSRKYCRECREETQHVRQNSGGEVAAKVLLGVFSMGMSVGLTETVYECTKCGEEKTE